MITIQIDGTDRSSIIQFGSVSKTDAINQQTDTLNFSILYHAGQTFRPETNSEVIMLDGATKVFAGKIYAVEKSIQGNGTVKYTVKVKDYSYDLGRLLVVEGYENMTVEEIIADVLSTYASGFTGNNVSCTLDVVKVVFDRITVVEVLNRLAEMSGYSWYVDYDKDVHFFEKNTEPAPFNLIDGDGNHIPETLQASDDFSQIRNRVFIKGGEIEGESRTETFDGNGTKKQFKLANKFAKKPTVTVSSVAKTVGVDYLDDEDSFDCFWDYNQSYIRFKDTTIPGAGTDNIEVSGIPLYRLVVQVEEPFSMEQYGIFEFAKTDKTIKSREAAVAMAKSEIQAYKDGLIEGSFETYTSGLRSGQVIRITSTLLDIDEQFLIQRVGFKMLSTTDFYYKVELATLRTVGIIDFLIGLLRSGDHVIEDTGETVLEKTVFPIENFTLGDAIAVNTDDYPQNETLDVEEAVTVQALDYDTQFVLGPQLPSSTKRVFILDGSPLA